MKQVDSDSNPLSETRLELEATVGSETTEASLALLLHFFFSDANLADACRKDVRLLFSQSALS